MDPIQVYKDVVAQTLKRFKPGTGAGASGLKVEHLLTLVKANLLDSLVAVLTKMVNGNIGEHVAPFLFGANLFALLKPNKDVRPIACGEVLRRLAGKILCRNFGDAFREYLAPHQYGVSVSGGIEACVHSAASLLHPDLKPDMFGVKLDFQNAFNEVDQEKFLEAVRVDFPQLYPYVHSMWGRAIPIRNLERSRNWFTHEPK